MRLAPLFAFPRRPPPPPRHPSPPPGTPRGARQSRARPPPPPRATAPPCRDRLPVPAPSVPCRSRRTEPSSARQTRGGRAGWARARTGPRGGRRAARRARTRTLLPCRRGAAMGRCMAGVARAGSGTGWWRPARPPGSPRGVRRARRRAARASGRPGTVPSSGAHPARSRSGSTRPTRTPARNRRRPVPPGCRREEQTGSGACAHPWYAWSSRHRHLSPSNARPQAGPARSSISPGRRGYRPSILQP
eukprot:scaffold29394_cov112-Isochrysis_galbana.AAC.3